MQQYQLCSTASSEVCQHCSEMLKSPKCKFSRFFRVVHILGGIPICLRMALFLIPFDCSLESFPHVFPQQASPIAMSVQLSSCCSGKNFPFSSPFRSRRGGGRCFISFLCWAASQHVCGECVTFCKDLTVEGKMSSRDLSGASEPPLH